MLLHSKVNEKEESLLCI